MIKHVTREHKRLGAIIFLHLEAKSIARVSRSAKAELRTATPERCPDLQSYIHGALRRRARCVYLALAFLRGRSYRSVEKKSLCPEERLRLSVGVSHYVYANVKGAVADTFAVLAWLSEEMSR